MKEIITKLLLFIAIIAASIYLTFYIDVFTLNTLLKRLFIFCYFFIMCSIAVVIKKKKNFAKSNSLTFLCALAISLIILSFFQNSFLPLKQETQIYLKANESIDLIDEKEIWLTDIIIDGEKVTLAQLDIEYNNGWVYSSPYDDFVFYPSEATDNILILNTISKDIELIFAQNAWSGSVEIAVNNSVANKLNLNKINASDTVSFFIQTEKNYSLLERTILNCGAAVVLVFCINIVLNVFKKYFIRFREKKSLSKRNILLILLLFFLTISTLYTFIPSLLYEEKIYEISITSLDQCNPASKGYELELIPLSNNSLINQPVIYQDSGWVYNQEKNNYLCTKPNQTIVFQASSLDNTLIEVIKNQYAATFHLEYLDSSMDIDLYNDTVTRENIHIETTKTQKNINEIIIGILGISIVFLLILVWLYCTTGEGVFSALAISFISFTMVWKSEQYSIFLITAGIALFSLFYFKEIKNRLVNAYLSKRYFRILIMIVAIYTSFALWGQELFYQNVLADFSANKIIAFINLTIMSYYIVLLILEVFELIASKIRVVHHNKLSNKKFKLISFGTLSAILVFWCFVFYPANMTSDGVDQWCQAMGYYQIGNAHPAIHTIFIRLCSWIYPAPISVTIVQSLLFAYVLTQILGVFHRRGQNEILLLIMAFVIAILPNTIAMMTLVSKNILFAILLLWLVYLMIELCEKPELFFRDKYLMIQLIIVLPVCYVIRHNAFVILPVILFALIFVALKYYRTVGIRPLVCICLIFSVLWGITNPLYDAFEVQKVNNVSTREMVRPLIMPFIPAMISDVAIDADTEIYLDKILPREEFVSRYSPYNGDILVFSTPALNLTDVTVSESLKHYLNLLLQRPDIVIKDRLDGVNLIWDIWGKSDIPNGRHALGIWGAESCVQYLEMQPNVFLEERKQSSVVYQTNDGITNIVKGYIYLSQLNSILDSIIWRNGLYLLLTIISIIYLIKHKLFQFIWLLMIPFSILCTLILVVNWQIYQYIYFFPLCTIFILYYILMQNKG